MFFNLQIQITTNMSDSTLVALANELAVAVEITMNPEASQQQRMEAYIACEK
jgi:hypothetical protein